MAQTSPYTIDDYKNTLGYGARNNLFLLELQFPTVIANPVAEQQFAILCQTGTFPAPRKHSVITKKFQGSLYKLAGEKDDTEDLNYTLDTNEAFTCRTQCELWLELIQAELSGKRTVPSTYKSPLFYVSVLNHNKEVIKKVQLVGAFITGLNNIELNMEGGEILPTEISFAYDAPVPVPLT